jgi:hypothetical protein
MFHHRRVVYCHKYDNHDRSTVLLKGEKLIKIDHTTHIPIRAHHILTHTFNTEETRDAFHFPIPSYTMEFHLITMICTELTLPFHYNPLPFHPFIPSAQLDIADIHTATTGVFIHIYDIPFFLGEQIDTLILTDIKVCLITSQEGLPVQHSEPPIIIGPDTLMVHISGTWRGDTRPSPETRNHDNLYTVTTGISPHRRWLSSLTTLGENPLWGKVGPSTTYPQILS